MTKEQFRQIAKLLAKVKADVENIMDGELTQYNIYRLDQSTTFNFRYGNEETHMMTWIEDGADVENGKIIEYDNSMWIRREEEF